MYAHLNSTWKLDWQLHTDTGSHSHLNESIRSLKLTQEPEDFELKKGLLCLLARLSADQAAAKIMAEEKVVRSLLSFVTRNDKVDSCLWNPAQFEELQLLVSLPLICHASIWTKYRKLTCSNISLLRHFPVCQLLPHSVLRTMWPARETHAYWCSLSGALRKVCKYTPNYSRQYYEHA